MVRIIFAVIFVLSNQAVAQVSEVLPYKGAPVRSLNLGSPLKDTAFYTLAKDVSLVGPLIPWDEDNYQGRAAYVKTVFRRLIQKADKLVRFEGNGKGYTPNSNENYNYYAFLVLALTVPHHESSLTHAREATGGYCDQRTNELMRSPPGARRVLSPIYRDPAMPLFPDCRFFNEAESVKQVANSNNHDDVGLMQINPKSHPEAMEPDTYLNLYNTIDYGLTHLYQDGFAILTSRFEKYPCEFNKNPYGTPGTRSTIYFNLLRAAWASKYNQGNLKSESVCRFIIQNDHDAGFLRSLRAVVITDSSIYHRYLPQGSVERNAFLEIINNYRAIFTKVVEPEQNANLNKILAMPFETTKNWQSPNRTRIETTHILKKGKINVYSTKGISQANGCGYLTSQGSTRIAVLNAIDVQNGSKLAVVQIPPYASYAHIYRPVYSVRLKRGVTVARLRSQPQVDPNNIVGELRRNRSTSHSAEAELISAEQGADKSWYLIRLDSEEVGYVHSSVTELVEGAGDTPPECQTPTLFIQASDLKSLPIDYNSERQYMAEVTGSSRAFIRERADSRAPQVDVVEVGDELLIVGDNGKRGEAQWFEVVLPDGSTTGWIWSSRVELKREVKK